MTEKENKFDNDPDLADFDDLSEAKVSQAQETVSGVLDHPDVLALRERLEAEEKKAHDYWNKYLSAEAQMQNIRLRAEKDIAAAHAKDVQKFVDSVLPVIDSLEQAILATEKAGESAASILEGLNLTLQLFQTALGRFSVSVINPLGEPFNPNLHEAMAIQESADVAPNTVLVVFQKGYVCNDKVIRAARVVVSKG